MVSERITSRISRSAARGRVYVAAPAGVGVVLGHLDRGGRNADRTLEHGVPALELDLAAAWRRYLLEGGNVWPGFGGLLEGQPEIEDVPGLISRFQIRSMSSGTERRTEAGPPCTCMSLRAAP